MSEVTVRKAKPSDAQFIAEGNRAMAQETEGKQLDPDTVLAGVRSALSDQSKGFYLVAEHGGHPAGQLMVTHEWSDWRNGDFWWIQSVHVLPDHRKRGVFTALYRHLEKMARQDPEVCGIRLYTHETNQTAHATYQSLGMKRVEYQVFESVF
jgi:ribosomal protein S18 acetylase RimI-like enzyme